MSNKKNRTVWQHKFNLSSDNPDDVRLHEYLIGLTRNGGMMKWVREGLTSLLPVIANRGNTVLPRQSMSKTLRTELPDEPPDDDTIYAPIEDIA